MSLTIAVPPPITVLTRDLTRLETLASAAAKSNPVVAEFLADELARAELEARPMPGLVVMGSSVVYRDDVSDEIRTARLVYPDAADMSQGRLSVLSPLGAALLGLSVGQSIEFPTPRGGRRSVTVLSVEQ